MRIDIRLAPPARQQQKRMYEMKRFGKLKTISAGTY